MGAPDPFPWVSDLTSGQQESVAGAQFNSTHLFMPTMHKTIYLALLRMQKWEVQSNTHLLGTTLFWALWGM